MKTYVKHPESGTYKTVNALAREAGISIPAVRKALQEHRLSGIKDADGRWLIPTDDPLARTWLTGQNPDQLLERLERLEERVKTLEER
jgi:DNA-binding transcriptional MerR regulator